jgi:hypothetical protein
MNRFIEEVQKSVSSGVSFSNEFDISRLKSYLDSVDRYHAWIKAQPQLDLPETSPRAYTLPAPPPDQDVENEDLGDVLRMFSLARDEVINSQTSRLGSGILAPDSARLTAVVQKVRAFLLDYIVPTQPLDLPESSPQDPMTGSGRTGV